jgi:hypothetical protein
LIYFVFQGKDKHPFQKKNAFAIQNRIFNEKASGGFEAFHSLNIAVHFLMKRLSVRNT